MPLKPRLENAPGCILRKRKDGWGVIWQPRTDLKKKGYVGRSRRICIVSDPPTPEELAFVADIANSLQNDMLQFSRGGAFGLGMFDGTIEGLISCYETDPDSPYQKMRYQSRRNYQAFFRRLIEDCGKEKIAEVKARQILRWHALWMGRGLPMAHQTMTILRIVLTFGATILDSKECRELREMLADMKFPMAPRRVSILTSDHAIAIRRQAHADGLPSIALAQAIQFECTLRQKDVIGEWVPQSEKELSDVLHLGNKWLRGIRWEEIDDNLVLHHITSKKLKLVEPDLKLAPMVFEEFALLGERPKKGPIIIHEATGLPYLANTFRKVWRGIADKAGVPKDVHNMDSRAGAISEATDAGASLEHVRHAATHSDIATTQGYSRNSAEKTAQVQKQRIAHRNKTGT